MRTVKGWATSKVGDAGTILGNVAHFFGVNLNVAGVSAALRTKANEVVSGFVDFTRNNGEKLLTAFSNISFAGLSSKIDNFVQRIKSAFLDSADNAEESLLGDIKEFMDGFDKGLSSTGCFVAGTLVKTTKGLVPIEEV